MALNSVQLIGNLSEKPELKNVNGTPVTQFSIAENEIWTDKSGQRKESTQWHNIVVWGRSAENCSNYLSKGSKVFIQGKIKYDVYEKDGQKRYITKIIAQKVVFLDTRNGARQDDKSQPQPNEMNLDDIPF